MIVKILGSGCKNCNVLMENAKEAFKSLEKEAEFIKVTDFKEIASLGVMKTPGLVINDKVISSGKVLSKDEIIEKIK